GVGSDGLADDIRGWHGAVGGSRRQRYFAGAPLILRAGAGSPSPGGSPGQPKAASQLREDVPRPLVAVPFAGRPDPRREDQADAQQAEDRTPGPAQPRPERAEQIAQDVEQAVQQDQRPKGGRDGGRGLGAGRGVPQHAG